MKRLPINLFTAICLCFILLASCQIKTPKEIIQPDKMEALLYDYHIVQAMGNEKNVQEYHTKLYHEYVFKKHGVTKAMFDSSMVWYTRHPSHLTQMYGRLQKRLDYEVAIMQDEKAIAQIASESNRDLTADTLELWKGKSVTELTSAPYNNRLLLFFESDSAFVAGDSIAFNINTRFFAPKANMQQIYAAILVSYNDDTTESKSLSIDASGRYAIEIERNYERQIKALRGFIYYNDNDKSATSGVALSGLSLLRIHPPVEESEE